MSPYLAVKDHVTEFAEDKDVARGLRRTVIAPAVKAEQFVEVDSAGVDVATQSFVHALLGEVIREQPEEALRLLAFRNCSAAVKSTITLVAEYVQDTTAAPGMKRKKEKVATGSARGAPRRMRRGRKKQATLPCTRSF